MNKNATTHTLKHSTWITSAWNWFMELVGRGAEAILVASVLYQSVKLLPTVHLPASLDVAVFIAQFVALDIGGLSLGKLAKQAKREGNVEGAAQASRMSNALITIMIAGVVVVALEQLFKIPTNWELGIDTILLIARSILAVLYGHIIHTLKVDDEGRGRPSSHTLQADNQAALSWALVAMGAMHQEQLAVVTKDLHTRFEQRLSKIASDLAHMQTVTATTQSIDVEALTEAMRHHVEAASEAKFASFLRQSEARFEALMRQRITVNEAHEARQSEAVRQRIEAPKPPHEANNEATRRASQSSHAASKIVNLRQPEKQPETASTDRRAAVYALLEAGDARSSYQLAPVVGCSAATIQRYMKDHKTERDEAAM